MLILTSSVASVAQHVHENYLKSKGFKSILFIDTAAEPEIGHEEGDDDWLLADFGSLKGLGYQTNLFTVTGKSFDEIKQTIDSYDIIYMCGGNTKYLLDKLKETETFAYIKEQVQAGKPYIGTSAGSIVAGPKLPDYFYDTETLEDIVCFNFVNFTLIPHWGSVHFKDTYLGERLKKVYNDKQVPLLLLTDYQYVYIKEDGSLRIENTNKL